MTTYSLPTRTSKTTIYRYPAGADSCSTTSTANSSTMASHARVSFKPSPVYSRLPRDDEACVMRTFARHAGHCHRCADPYAVHRRGGSLCPKGHGYALDVAQYVYNRNGQAYSVVDREGYQRVQIEIPANCEAVRSLLKALERGLRLIKADEQKGSAAAPKSYDRTYYVQPRPVSVHQSTRPISTPSSRSSYKPSTYSTSPASSFSSDTSSERASEHRYPSQPSNATRTPHPKAYKSRPQVYYKPSPHAEPIPIEATNYWR